MRRFWAIVFFFAFACATVAASSPQEPFHVRLVRLGLKSSKIPQFIRDKDHPWINENVAVLEELNAAEALCNAESPLRSQLPTLPKDLFESLVLDPRLYNPRNRAGLVGLRNRLLEVQSCREALQMCRKLQVDISRNDGDYDAQGKPRKSHKVMGVARLFVDVLSSMPSLQQLDWFQASHDAPRAALFEAVFLERQLVLPTVTQLRLSPHTHFLVPMAPCVESLATRGTFSWYSLWPLSPLHELIDASREAKNLTEFELQADWDGDLFQRVLCAMPQLQTLRLEGEMKFPYPFELENHPPHVCKFTAILATLQKFENLRNLHLPGIWGDDLDLYWAQCGSNEPTIFDTLDGRIQSRKLISGIERAGKMVVEQLPQLDSLTISGHSTDPRSRTDEGRLIWPWTGRLKEHILDDWPRYKMNHVPWENSGDGDPEGWGWGVDEDPEGPVFGSWENDEAMFAADWGLNGLENWRNVMSYYLERYEFDHEEYEKREVWGDVLVV